MRLSLLLAVTALVGCAADPPPPASTTTPDTSLRPDPTDAAPALQRSGGPFRNLLIISVDTLRRDAVTRWGGPGDTPFLDARLGEGVPLDDFQSCSNSTPASFLCLYTGRAAYDWGFQLREGPDGLDPVSPYLDLASELFQRLGFRTGTVTASPMMSELVPDFLDSFEDAVATEWEGHYVTGQALDLGAAYASEPRRWMMHVHYMEPHAPLTPPDDLLADLVQGLDEARPEWTFGNLWLRQLHEDWPALSAEDQALLMAHVQARYRASVRSFDRELERLWQGLDALGLLDDTLVLLWADHGEQFNERGRWTHGMDVFTEELSTLAGFWGQGLTAQPFGGPTDVTDLLPTALEALGLAGQPQADAALAEATGYVLGTAPAHRPRAVLWTGESTRLSYRVGPHAMIYDLEGEAWFFDMVADPAQQHDRYNPADPAVIALWQQIREHLPALGEEPGPDGPTAPPGLEL